MIELAGSERMPLPDVVPAGSLDTAQRLELTLLVRRHAPGAIGASVDDLALVGSTMTRLGLEVTSVHAASRRVRVAGTLGALSQTFGTSLRMVRSRSGVTHRYREGALYLPDELAGVVLAVLGLDNRPQAVPHFRVASAATPQAASDGTFTSAELAALYGFPAGTTGAGRTIALIELGGGFSTSDIAACCAGLGVAMPQVTAVSVDGATDARPGSAADTEVALDIQVIIGAAPGAAQVVYFAPNSDQGFIDAVAEAAHATPAPAAISISWGQPEDKWSEQARNALDGVIADASALGVTVCVAAGDHGSSDGVTDQSPHVDFPAASPHALSCGGTRVVAASGVISAETAWNDGAGGGAGGGGVSEFFPLPSWQSAAGVPGRSGSTGRGVPDVAGNGDPQTGYRIVVGGQPQVIGGTSAVAPLWAALIARIAEALGRPLGLVQPAFYRGVTPGTAAAGFRDIVTGTNGAYAAGPGWDACTGLGSPDGTALADLLR